MHRQHKIKVDPDKLTPENIQKFPGSTRQLSTALGRLLMVTENYPVLKANQNFLELQATLEGTERRIAVARKDFNEAAQQFNTYIRKFPQTLLAGMFGFSSKVIFQSDKGANKAPEVKFLVMANAADYGDDEQQLLLKNAIARTEKHTSGEIRIFIDSKSKSEIIDQQKYLKTSRCMKPNFNGVSDLYLPLKTDNSPSHWR